MKFALDQSRCRPVFGNDIFSMNMQIQRSENIKYVSYTSMLDTCTSLSLNLLFAVNLLNKLKAGIIYDTTGAPGLRVGMVYSCSLFFSCYFSI